VTKSRATGQVRSPIARVHVAHCDQKSRARECSQLPPERRRPRNYNAPVNFGEGDLARASAPRRVRLPLCDVIRSTHEFTLYFDFSLAKLTYIALSFYSSTIIYFVDYFEP